MKNIYRFLVKEIQWNCKNIINKYLSWCVLSYILFYSSNYSNNLILTILTVINSTNNRGLEILFLFFDVEKFIIINKMIKRITLENFLLNNLPKYKY